MRFMCVETVAVLFQMGTNATSADIVAAESNRYLSLTTHHLPRLLAPLWHMSVHQLFDKFHALVLEELCVLVDPSVERHGDLPGTGEDIRVFDRGFVVQVVSISEIVALDHV